MYVQQLHDSRNNLHNSPYYVMITRVTRAIERLDAMRLTDLFVNKSSCHYIEYVFLTKRLQSGAMKKSVDACTDRGIILRLSRA